MKTYIEELKEIAEMYGIEVTQTAKEQGGLFYTFNGVEKEISNDTISDIILDDFETDYNVYEVPFIETRYPNNSSYLDAA